MSETIERDTKPARKHWSIALVGNPNAGKTSLFNLLTGLNQKVGNFPGITVERKEGKSVINREVKARIVDLPGTYSIYPHTSDERVVLDILTNPSSESFPDLVVVVADATNLERNLLLFTQIHDLGIPVILALNMVETAEKRGFRVNEQQLSEILKVPVIRINAREGTGIDQLKSAIANYRQHSFVPFTDITQYTPELVSTVKAALGLDNDYRAYLCAQHLESSSWLSEEEKSAILHARTQNDFRALSLQTQETSDRYRKIGEVLQEVTEKADQPGKQRFTARLDQLITHPVLGYVIFFLILAVIFQAIFAWATIPMDFIDWSFASLGASLQEMLPEGPLNALLTEGIIPGIAGVVIFIPQIALLFLFIAILEESGYMARVVFLMDRVMSRFGLNGRSVVPLISGVACAVPAIMATRNVGSWKDRLLTIFVIPLMSCSARLPVYTILIALIVPNKTVLGLVNQQGLVLMAMYLLGFVMALLTAVVARYLVNLKESSFLIMELPDYRVPRWKNVGITIYEKSSAFVMEAGKIILAISIILWLLASYSPGDKIEQVERELAEQVDSGSITEAEFEKKLAARELELSYAGIMGRAIEPVIEPLGYDWKIGIALITSFAAREVFVSTISTLYSIGDANEQTIKQRLASETVPETGEKRFTPAVAFSLMVFYAFAMQCMSTLAVVKRETNSWKWPLIQLTYMTLLAYFSALFVYQVFQ